MKLTPHTDRGAAGLIIGAGIGGLCAAMALRIKGIDAIVYERAPEIREVGAGLSLWVNATRALRLLGLGKPLDEMSVTQLNAGLRSWKGHLIAGFRSDDPSRPKDTEVVIVHRADLQAALVDAVGADRIRTGWECESVESSDQVIARFTNGREARGRFLIGADGVNSVVRSCLFGRSKPVYSGYFSWRAVTEFDSRRLPDGMGFESWGRGCRFGALPMSGGRVYWFASRNAPECEPDGPQGRKQEIIELFRGWHEPIREIIESTDESVILKNDIVDRNPLSRWSRGPITLLGDAAHPMTPNLGQGACQCIEDAVVVAECLDQFPDPTMAFAAYESQRVDRTSRIVLRSRQVGRIAQLDNALLCRLRNAFMRMVPPSVHFRQIRRIVNHDIQTRTPKTSVS